MCRIIMFCTVAQIALYRNLVELPPLACSNEATLEYQPHGKEEPQEQVFRNIVFGYNHN